MSNIATETKFNGKQLLNGTMDHLLYKLELIQKQEQ